MNLYEWKCDRSIIDSFPDAHLTGKYAGEKEKLLYIINVSFSCNRFNSVKNKHIYFEMKYFSRKDFQSRQLKIYNELNDFILILYCGYAHIVCEYQTCNMIKNI